MKQAKDRFLSALASIILKIISLFERVKSFFSKPSQSTPTATPFKEATPKEPTLVEEEQIIPFPDLPVSDKQKRTLDDLLQRLGTEGIAELGSLMWERDRINNELQSIHPLKSLEHMLTKRYNLKHLGNIKERANGFIWAAFTKDIGHKLEVQHNQKQIVPFFDAFCGTIGIEATASPLPGTAYEWEEWVKKTILQKIDNSDTLSQHSSSSSSKDGTISLGQTAENQEPEGFGMAELAKQNLCDVLRHFAENGTWFLAQTSPLKKDWLMPVHPLRIIIEIFQDPGKVAFFKIIMGNKARNKTFLHYFAKILKEISQPEHRHNLTLFEDEFALKMAVPLHVFQSYLLAAGHDGWKHLIQVVYRYKEENKERPATP
ncbi:MAG: hypothetical protein EB051_00835 [Chlamydiia bacterium]|nr:hypothetical protein [Chlamydiia bacterium]